MGFARIDLNRQKQFLTLSAHAREGYSSHFVCLSVCHFLILEKEPFSGLKLTPVHSRCRFKGTVSRYIDKNRTGACGLGRNRRLLRHTELVFLSTVCARRVVLVLFTNMDAVN